ncbi:MAG: hypothetical protein Q7R50_05970 [Dehalococcoidales bacterium]|nr:hypothetical protein [Dehalococcoidales bacterium]
MKKVTFVLAAMLVGLAGCVSQSVPSSENSNSKPAAAPQVTAMIDWVDFIKLNDITYLSASQTNSINESDLSPYAEIKFKVADNVNYSNYRAKNGDAAYLEPGTQVYSLKDYDPSFRLVVKRYGTFVIFESDTNPSAKNGSDLLDLNGKVDYITVNSPMDGKTVLASIKDPAQVTNLVGIILEAPVDQSSGAAGKEQYFLEFHLKDGTSTLRSFWLDTGMLFRGIKLPKEFTEIIRSALNK